MSNFDYFLLSFSYAPTFCKLNPDKSNSKECSGNYTLVLHGLWPSYNHNNEYPQFCDYPQKYSKEQLQTIVSQISGWEKYAPEYMDLCVHEWEKHGTCSGLSPEDYFKLAFTLCEKYYRDIPENFDNNTLQNLFPDGILKYEQDLFSGVEFKINK